MTVRCESAFIILTVLEVPPSNPSAVAHAWLIVGVFFRSGSGQVDWASVITVIRTLNFRSAGRFGSRRQFTTVQLFTEPDLLISYVALYNCIFRGHYCHFSFMTMSCIVFLKSRLQLLDKIKSFNLYQFRIYWSIHHTVLSRCTSITKTFLGPSAYKWKKYWQLSWST